MALVGAHIFVVPQLLELLDRVLGQELAAAMAVQLVRVIVALLVTAVVAALVVTRAMVVVAAVELDPLRDWLALVAVVRAVMVKDMEAAVSVCWVREATGQSGLVWAVEAEVVEVMAA